MVHSFRFRYCYCGESGDWYRKMLQCDRCQQWFHQECIRSNLLPQLLLGDRFFEFICTICTGTTEEHIVRKDMSLADAVHLALFNLTVCNNNKYHDVTTSLMPFLRRRWKDFQGPNGRLKVGRISQPEFLIALLRSHKSRFRCGSDLNRVGEYWGLRKVAPPAASKNQVNGVVMHEVKKDKQIKDKQIKANNGPRGRPKKRRMESLDSAVGDSENAFSSLESLIPPPKSFHGFNNPFRETYGPPILIPEVSNGGSCSCNKSSSKRRFFRDRYASSNASSVCTKCSGSKTDSGFTTSPERTDDDESCSNSLSSVTDVHPPPLLDCTEEKPPVIDLFQPPSIIRDLKTHQRHFAARRLTLDGDIQYLMDWSSNNHLTHDEPTVNCDNKSTSNLTPLL